MYGRIRYEEVYPGIDVVYRGQQHQLEYDFIVEPGADPDDIQLAVHGAGRIFLDGEGALHLETPAGEVLLHAPVIYQEIDGVRQNVPGWYVLRRWLEAGCGDCRGS